jgi:hypothetical protein
MRHFIALFAMKPLLRPLSYMRMIAHCLRGSRLLLIGCLSVSGYAQALGSLVGTVRDASGAVIANATVTAIEQQTDLTLVRNTRATGDYAFDNLPIGTYTVVFVAPSFRELRVSGIQTHIATVLRQDATLELVPVSATAEVRSSTPLVKTETAEIGQLVDSRQIANRMAFI